MNKPKLKKLGGTVLTAKTDEYARWVKLCEQAGRSGDLIRFGPGCGLCFNPIGYELNAPGGTPESASKLVMYMVEAANRNAGSHADEQFWALGSFKLIHNSIQLVHLATGECTMADIDRVLASAPRSPEEVDSEKWRRESFLAQCLRTLANGDKYGREAAMLADYFCGEWAGMSSKPKSILHSMTTNITSKFMQSPLYELTVGKSTLTPDACLDGKWVVVDLPLLRWRDPGQFLQIAWKTSLQRAVLRRDYTPDMRAVAVFMDEAQMFVTAEDPAVLAVSRQARMPHISITQTLPGLFSALGGNEKARMDGESWIAGHMSRIHCSNFCNTTNKFCSDATGHSKQALCSGNMNFRPYDVISDVMRTESHDNGGSAGWSEQWLPEVRPEDFTRLKKGGDANGKIVEAFVMQGGRIFKSTGKTWTISSFRQNY